MDVFPAQAHRLATTRQQHARIRVNIDRAVDDLRRRYISIAVDFLTAGATDDAEAVMRELLTEQCKLAKIRHLESVPT